MTEKRLNKTGTAAHWRFDSRYFQSGSLEENNLIRERYFRKWKSSQSKHGSNWKRVERLILYEFSKR